MLTQSFVKAKAEGRKFEKEVFKDGKVELLKPFGVRDQFVPNNLLALDRDHKSEIKPSTRRYYIPSLADACSDSSRAVGFGYG